MKTLLKKIFYNSETLPVETVIRNARVAAAIGILGYAPWGWLVNKLYPDLVDSVWLRSPVWSLCILLFIFSYIKKTVRFMNLIILIIVLAATIQLTGYFLQINESYVYMSGSIIVCTVSAVVIINRKHLFMYVLSNLIITTWSFSKLGWSNINIFFYLQILTALILCFIFGFYRIYLLEENAKKESLLKYEIESKEQLVFAARQAVHDIRSPLSAINAILESNTLNSFEMSEMLKQIAKRINNIADTLLTKTRNEHVCTLIDSTTIYKSLLNIINEKKSTFSAISWKIENNVSSVFYLSNIFELNELIRSISNLLQNSAEATPDGKSISVELSNDNFHLFILIKDEGKGIPKHVLNKLGKIQITYGKKNGNGLGAYTAFKTIYAMGGKIRISSTEGLGTQVEIKFKLHA